MNTKPAFSGLHPIKIKNARIFYDGSLQNLEMLFDQEKILQIAPEIEVDDDVEIIDAKGLAVLPGLVDTHVHLREPGYEAKETIAAGSRAAAAGGFTTIFAMPNLRPYPSTVETMEPYLEKSRTMPLYA
ncbi:amidohydrolase family protein [Allobaculum sp. Allo2]|uniref:amidohydrolase family protein n=1 Tax=Allobaculum sp. Allo2 TaxID=2853432 RepID=UPI001F6056CA|nr:amidohydrolase family protein [Allobaculum sp. Allo2]